MSSFDLSGPIFHCDNGNREEFRFTKDGPIAQMIVLIEKALNEVASKDLKELVKRGSLLQKLWDCKDPTSVELSVDEIVIIRT